MIKGIIFDFDGTLIKGDSIVRFCLYAYRKGLCSLRQLLPHGFGPKSLA